MAKVTDKEAKLVHDFIMALTDEVQNSTDDSAEFVLKLLDIQSMLVATYLSAFIQEDKRTTVFEVFQGFVLNYLKDANSAPLGLTTLRH